MHKSLPSLALSILIKCPIYALSALRYFRPGKGNLYAEYIMRNAGLEEAQAGIKIAGRNIKTSDMQMTPPSWQKVKKN